MRNSLRGLHQFRGAALRHHQGPFAWRCEPSGSVQDILARRGAGHRVHTPAHVMGLYRLLILAAQLQQLIAGATQSACDGYSVSGAGDQPSNGCYARKPGVGYVLDATHAIYSDAGVWRLGHRGKEVMYVAQAASREPPLLAAAWACGSEPAPGYRRPGGIRGAACPPPSLVSHLPPPTPPPPPGPPGSSMYPVPTTASDKAVDCAVRRSAWQYAQHIQPWGGGHLPVFDALEVSGRCHQSRPAPPPPRVAAGRGGQRVARLQLRPPRASTLEQAATAATFHADALHGKDNGGSDGSVGAPFATIGRGVRACRDANRQHSDGGSGGRGGAGGRVVSRGCTLFLADSAPFVLREALRLTAEDSHLTIMPEPSAVDSPVITGSVRLTTPWAAHNTSAGMNVWKTAIPAGFGQAAVYSNGQRAVMARWPNVDDPATSQIPIGYAAPAGWLPPRPRPSAIPVLQPDARRPADQTFPSWGWARAAPGSPPTFSPAEGYWLAEHPQGGYTYTVPSGVVYSAGAFSERAGSWFNASTGHVHAFHGEYWGNWIFEIAAHNRANHTLHFGAGGSQEARGSEHGGAFFVENIFEELDHPREYFIDESASELYYFHNASAGTPPPAGSVSLALLEQLVTVTGSAAEPVQGLTFRGLTFTASRPTFLSQLFKAPSGGDCEWGDGGAAL
jgi:hypothetical protein